MRALTECRYADSYKATREPKCGCLKCWRKWSDAQRDEASKLRTEVERLLGLFRKVEWQLGFTCDGDAQWRDVPRKSAARVREYVDAALAPEPTAPNRAVVVAPKHSRKCPRRVFGCTDCEEHRCTCGATPPVEGGE